MRARFVLGVLGVRVDQPLPPPSVLVDFVKDWGSGGPGTGVILTIRFCPFCGKEIRMGRDRTEVVP